MAFPPPGEEPFAVHAYVLIEVADGHHDPLVPCLVLGAAVDRAGGPVRAGELDAVPADLVHRPVEPAHHRVDVAPQRLPAGAVSAHVHVRPEAVHPGLHVPGVHGHRIPDGQLLDGQMRLDALHALGYGARVGHEITPFERLGFGVWTDRPAFRIISQLIPYGGFSRCAGPCCGRCRCAGSGWCRRRSWPRSTRGSGSSSRSRWRSRGPRRPACPAGPPRRRSPSP